MVADRANESVVNGIASELLVSHNGERDAHESAEPVAVRALDLGDDVCRDAEMIPRAARFL